MALPVHFKSDKGESIVFDGVSWGFYEAVLDECGESPSRISYDDGKLEIEMTLSIEHEGYKEFIGDLISQISLVLQIPMARRGSTTLKLASKSKGLEADRCYWIQNVDAIRGVKRLDLTIHPAPDLVLEVDVSHSAVDRESIYASLGVTEMWHFDVATKLTGWRRILDGWERTDQSISFPMIRIAELNMFVARFTAGEDESAILNDFRSWLSGLKK